MIGGLTYVPLSDIGVLREENQDYQGHDLTPLGMLFIVADGMGGHAGGATASQMAVNHMRRAFNTMGDEHPVEALRDSIQLANYAICNMAAERPELHGMGSTIVALLVQEHQAYIAHVGDSRIYLLRGNKLHQMTKDHTMVQRLVDEGILLPEQAENHQKSHILNRSLGGKDWLNVDVRQEPIELHKGDIFILCSDGLTGLMDDAEIGQILLNTEIHQAARTLVDEVNARGGHDNTTIALVRIDEAPLRTVRVDARYPTPELLEPAHQPDSPHPHDMGDEELGDEDTPESPTTHVSDVDGSDEEEESSNHALLKALESESTDEETAWEDNAEDTHEGTSSEETSESSDVDHGEEDDGDPAPEHASDTEHEGVSDEDTCTNDHDDTPLDEETTPQDTSTDAPVSAETEKPSQTDSQEASDTIKVPEEDEEPGTAEAQETSDTPQASHEDNAPVELEALEDADDESSEDLLAIHVDEPSADPDSYPEPETAVEPLVFTQRAREPIDDDGLNSYRITLLREGMPALVHTQQTFPKPTETERTTPSIETLLLILFVGLTAGMLLGFVLAQMLNKTAGP